MVELVGFSRELSSAFVIDVTDTEAFLVRKEGDGGDIFVVDTTNGIVSIGGVAPVAGCRLVLPLENDAVTPTLAFGDGSLGFFALNQSNLAVSVNGSWVFSMVATGLLTANTEGAGLINGTSSAVVPTLNPNRSDPDTGIGHAADNVLSIIAGSKEIIRANYVVNAVNYLDITPSAPGDPVLLCSGGVDADSDLQLNPKGLGKIIQNAPVLTKRTEVGAVDYNPSALTSDTLIAMTDTAAPRACTISTEDVNSGTTANPRIITIKDESGNAGTNNITVSLETGNIDGAGTLVLGSNYESVTLYLDGTNGWII